MTLRLALAAALLAAAPAAAQTIRGCDSFETSARNLIDPLSDTVRDYANGAIRVIGLDTAEPACCSYHVMVIHPLPDEPYPGCTLVSWRENLGFGGLRMGATTARYDPAIGLVVSIPASAHAEDGGARGVSLDLTVNQALGTVVAAATGGPPAPGPQPAPAPGK